MNIDTHSQVLAQFANAEESGNFSPLLSRYGQIYTDGVTTFGHDTINNTVTRFQMDQNINFEASFDPVDLRVEARGQSTTVNLSTITEQGCTPLVPTADPGLLADMKTASIAKLEGLLETEDPTVEFSIKNDLVTGSQRSTRVTRIRRMLRFDPSLASKVQTRFSRYWRPNRPDRM